VIGGHSGVHPEDVQAVFPSVAAHRLEPLSGSELAASEDVGKAILDAVAIP
jgi:hypothetical protein